MAEFSASGVGPISNWYLFSYQSRAKIVVDCSIIASGWLWISNRYCSIRRKYSARHTATRDNGISPIAIRSDSSDPRPTRPTATFTLASVIRYALALVVIVVWGYRVWKMGDSGGGFSQGCGVIIAGIFGADYLARKKDKSDNESKD